LEPIGRSVEKIFADRTRTPRSVRLHDRAARLPRRRARRRCGAVMRASQKFLCRRHFFDSFARALAPHRRVARTRRAGADERRGAPMRHRRAPSLSTIR
jgi:hypothetical protein